MTETTAEVKKFTCKKLQEEQTRDRALLSSVVVPPAPQLVSEKESEQFVLNKLRAWAKAKTSVHKYVTVQEVNMKESQLIEAIAGHDHAFKGDYYG